MTRFGQLGGGHVTRSLAVQQLQGEATFTTTQSHRRDPHASSINSPTFHYSNVPKLYFVHFRRDKSVIKKNYMFTLKSRFHWQTFCVVYRDV